MDHDPTSTGMSADSQMHHLLIAHCLEQAIYVAALLGIADLLAHGPLNLDKLASATGVHRPSLRRLLRALASIGVFTEDRSGRFENTVLSTTLRRDTLSSVRDRAIYYGTQNMWQVWGNLRYSVMTGESAFEYIHGSQFYDYISQNPEVGEPFNRYMSRDSVQHDAAITSSFDFSRLGTLVDVGGGHGNTLTAIVRANPAIRGILFDLPNVVVEAEARTPTDIRDRFSVIGGDMRESVPEGADAYLYKRILCDWSDDQVIKLLKNCAKAMPRNGKVLVAELLAPATYTPSLNDVMDLQMLLLFGGGGRRTESHFSSLFAKAGFSLAKTNATPSSMHILEGVLN
jgi:O-methyltransferase domain/Dimerisation domain